jgi:hypothetical protein
LILLFARWEKYTLRKEEEEECNVISGGDGDGEAQDI